MERRGVISKAVIYNNDSFKAQLIHVRESGAPLSLSVITIHNVRKVPYVVVTSSLYLGL